MATTNSSMAILDCDTLHILYTKLGQQNSHIVLDSSNNKSTRP